MNQEFIQYIAIQLVNGLVVRGAYILCICLLGPQTKQETTSKFLKDTIARHGENHINSGDLNARHVPWDAISNERGLSITDITNQTHRSHVLAAQQPSYFKTIEKKAYNST